MKDRLISTIMSFIIIFIFLTFGFIVVIFWNEFKGIQTSIEPQAFETIAAEDSGETEEYVDENQTEISYGGENKTDEEIKVPQIVENPLDQIKSEKDSQNQNNINYENVNVDKYFYNQLEEYAKVIYRAFESNKENMKTGTYQIEFGSAFSSLLKQSNGQDLLNTYYQSAIEAYIYDNPEIFYLNPNKMYLNIETTTRGSNVSYNAFINCGNQGSYLSDEFSSKQQIDQAIANVQQIRNNVLQNKTGNTYKDIKMVHDYIINNTEYDTTISRSNIYNIYGTLVSKQSVCEGYAKAFKYMMDGLGIPCTLTIGKGTNSEGRTENHAWNYVKLDGTWYAIDTTWDDPISDTGWVSESSKYRYFLKGSIDISKDHNPSGQFSEGGKVFSYPTLSVNNYQ